MLSAFSTLTSWINWNNWSSSSTFQQIEWNKWEEWQRSQVSEHYQKSDIFQYYLLYNPDHVNIITNASYKYCFGEFTCFINLQNGGNVLEYFTKLLNLYDICKGYSRKVTGDPYGITLLRQVLEKRTIVFLYDHDFTQYAYDYSKIHAHTVAKFSLSTLIMRLASNYLSFIYNKVSFPTIMLSVCQQAQKAVIFGIERKVSEPIDIVMNPSEKSHNSSWPSDNLTCLRCKTCSRVTENLWGVFNSCLDCHTKRICSLCGHKAIIIGFDNLPKCVTHQPKE